MSSVARFRAMGCEIVVAGATAAELDAVRALFDERDRIFSRFRADSELNRVNAVAGRFVRVSDEFGRALAVALRLAAATRGVLDPTLGAAIEAAGYDDDFDRISALDCGPARAGVPGCWRRVRATSFGVQVPPGVRLDLNGVVKAMAADDALALLAGDGYVSAGGDLAARGALTVAVPGGGSVDLVSGGLGTSGSGKRRWVRGGEVRHHLIDARTGRPAESPWEQVTASGRTCLAADAAAKLGYLLGDDGPEELDARGIAAQFVDPDGVVVENRSWRRAVEEPVCT
ncbi:MAG TPA: FAD:protein FMN transferase [Gaiellaceae bacterium]